MTRPTHIELREIVGQAIYEAHMKRPSQPAVGTAPLWLDVSQSVRKWVLEQADAAIIAFAKAGYMVESGLNDEVPEL